MDEGLVAFPPHRLDHPERGQRIDETRGAVGGGRGLRKHETVGGLQATVLRVHPAAERRDFFAEQRSRGLEIAGLDDDARALAAHGQGLIQAPCHALHHRDRESWP